MPYVFAEPGASVVTMARPSSARERIPSFVYTRARLTSTVLWLR